MQFMKNLLTQIQFYAWIYNSFINSHLLEWSKVLQIKSGIRVNFDQCELVLYFGANYLSRFVIICQVLFFGRIGVQPIWFLNRCMIIFGTRHGIGPTCHTTIQGVSMDPCHFQSSLNFTNLTCKLVESLIIIHF